MRNLILFLAALLFCCFTTTYIFSHNPLLVTRVIDGDTFLVNHPQNPKLRIRLIGVDAPETSYAYNRRPQPYGQEAKAFLQSLILNKHIKLEYDVDSLDRYGRTLAYAYLSDGRMVNDLLVAEGYAKVATYPPNVKYVDRFVESQSKARLAGKGLWE